MLPTIDELIDAAERRHCPPVPAITAALDELCPVSGADAAARLSKIAPALERLADASSDVRAGLLAHLPTVTGFHPRMIAFGLRIQCARFAPPMVERMLAAPHPRLRGAGLRTAIVHAGNVPALAALDVLVAVLAGDPVAVKTASREPLTGIFAAELLRAASGQPCAVGFSWNREEESLRNVLFAWAERLIAYGTDATISAMEHGWNACETSGRRREILPFGHRVSAAWVPTGGFALEELAQRLAVDVALWDQEGCLSPHVIFVEAGVDAPMLGAMLAESLATLSVALPRGDRTLEERAASRAWISSFEARVAAGTGEPHIFSDEGGTYTVVVDADAPIGPSPLGRAIRLVPVASAHVMLDMLRGWPLQALAVGDDPVRHARLIEPLRETSATRLCAAGRMQEPGPAWIGEETDDDGRHLVALEAETAGMWSELYQTASGEHPPEDREEER